MPAHYSQSDVLSFSGFLAYLRQQGFTIGLNHYVRLQELLGKIEIDPSSDDLKTLLCPLFATNNEQQEKFYYAFDSYFGLLQAASPNVEAVKSVAGTALASRKRTARMATRKWPYILGAQLLVAFVFVLTLWLTYRPVTVAPDGNTVANPPAQQTPNASDNTNPLTNTKGQTSPAQPETTEKRRNHPLEQNPALLAQPTPALETPTPQQSPTPEGTSLDKRRFYQRYGKIIGYTSILACVIYFLFYEWYRFNRRKLVLQKQHGKKPPYVWPIAIGNSAVNIYNSTQFNDAVRLLRRRQMGEAHRLDVPATVAATVKNFGYPKFRYRSDSKPPEYLLLIERVSFSDHQAQLFNELAKSMEREGLFVAHYFYEGDPRVCCDMAGKSCLSLVELQNRHVSHRLLLIGSGERMINPVTGRLESWTNLFSYWQERAVLTPESPAKWGFREIMLASQFIVLPASSEGLLALINQFDASGGIDWRGWQQRGRLMPQLDEPDRRIFIQSLRDYLGTDTFQWLCACAVYPELQWDLTLFLGTLPCMPAKLVNETNLLRLTRLPWFRDGMIPDELRWQLLQELDKDKEKIIRLAIIELLEKNPAPEESFASYSRQLNLVVQRWLYYRDRKRRRQLLETIKSKPRNQPLTDYAVMRYLESAPGSTLDVVLPIRLRRVFYKNGIAGFGLRTGIRLSLMLLTITAILVATVFLNRTPADASTTLAERVASTSLDGNVTKNASLDNKTYLEMTEDEKQAFISQRALELSRTIGNRSVEPVKPEAIIRIKSFVEVYARRLKSPRLGGACNFPRDDLTTILTRGSSNAPFIIDAFNEKGIAPQIGLYLAMIESEYCPCMQSPTGPLGMFQLTQATGRMYGLQIVRGASPSNPDERCKPELAARAVAGYMKFLMGRYGTGPLSVPLAIAIYSGGDGGLSTALASAMQEERSFWTLVANQGKLSAQFREDSIKYVQKFFAAAIVGENPQVFGVEMQPLSSYTDDGLVAPYKALEFKYSSPDEFGQIENYALKVMSSISDLDDNPTLSIEAVNTINQQVERYRGSSTLRDALHVMQQRGISQLAGPAQRSDLKLPLIIYGALAKIDNDNLRRDPVEVAEGMIPSLVRNRVVFGSELAQEVFLSLAATEPSTGGALALRDTIAELVRKRPEVRLETTLDIWFLRENKKLSPQAYDLVIRFLAIGVIAQNPKKFDVDAKPLTF